jgi:serine/threonine-protein kinase HipA
LEIFFGVERDPTRLTLEHWTWFARDIAITPAIVREELSQIAETPLADVANLRATLAETPAVAPLLDLAVDDISQRCAAAFTR